MAITYTWAVTGMKATTVGTESDYVVMNPPSFPGEETIENKTLSVDYGKITSVLIEAVKEQQAMIEQLNKKIDFLYGLLDSQ